MAIAKSVRKWEAKDGKLFNSRQEALDYGTILKDKESIEKIISNISPTSSVGSLVNDMLRKPKHVKALRDQLTIMLGNTSRRQARKTRQIEAASAKIAQILK